MIKTLGSILLILACSQPARAIDPGKTQGSLKIGGDTIELKEAYAHFHDNAEGLLDRAKEMRVVLCDREIPQESLRGIAFLPVTTLAREGKVRGLLIQFDPGDQSRLLVTVLRTPSRQGASLMTLSLADSEMKLFKKLAVSQTRIDGEAEYSEKANPDDDGLPKISYSVKFTAPVFSELPVTADLRGKAAQDSPQAQTAREIMIAMKKGDFEAVKRLSTERSNSRTDLMLSQMGGEAGSVAKEIAGEMEQSLRKIDRVVVRGSTAVMIYQDKKWSTFALENGQWRSDD